MELGRAFGLRVLAIGRPSDVELMARLGAECAVEGGDDVVGRVRLLVPGGVDGLVDTALMGAVVHAAIRNGGTFVAVRPLGAEPSDRIRTVWVTVSAYTGVASASSRIEDLWHTGRLTPRVATTVPATEVRRAADTVERPGGRGRVVLDLTDW